MIWRPVPAALSGALEARGRGSSEHQSCAPRGDPLHLMAVLAVRLTSVLLREDDTAQPGRDARPAIEPAAQIKQIASRIERGLELAGRTANAVPSCQS